MHKGIELASLAEKFPELSRYTNVNQMLVKLHRSVKKLADASHRDMGLDDISIATKYDIVGIDGHGVVAIASTPLMNI